MAAKRQLDRERDLLARAGGLALPDLRSGSHAAAPHDALPDPRLAELRADVDILRAACPEFSVREAAVAVLTGEVIGVAIDYSNIAYSASNFFDAALDVSELVNVIQRGRTWVPNHRSAAGSSTTARSPYWQATLERRGYAVRVEARSTGESEKFVDDCVQNMARAFVIEAQKQQRRIAKLSAERDRPPPEVKFVLVLATGDGNCSGRSMHDRASFVHVVRSALDLDMPVELVSWTKSLSGNFKRLQAEYEEHLLRIVPLDCNASVDVTRLLRWNTAAAGATAFRNHGLARVSVARGADGVPEVSSDILRTVDALLGARAEPSRAEPSHADPLPDDPARPETPRAKPAQPSGVRVASGPVKVRALLTRALSAESDRSDGALDASPAVASSALGLVDSAAAEGTPMQLSVEFDSVSARKWVRRLAAAFPMVESAMEAHLSNVVALEEALERSQLVPTDEGLDRFEAEAQVLEERLRSLGSQRVECEQWLTRCASERDRRLFSGDSEAAVTAQFQGRMSREALRLKAGLPFLGHRRVILEQLWTQESPFLAIAGESGCGKSTQTPALLAEFGIVAPEHGKRLLVTEPNATVARALAERVASEWQCEVGEFVGLDVPGFVRVSPDTCIVFSTHERVLRRLTLDISECASEEGGACVATNQRDELGDSLVWGSGSTDPELHAWLKSRGKLASERPEDAIVPYALGDFGVVLVDEAHDRPMEVDLLLGLVAQTCTSRTNDAGAPDLRLLVASASLDDERLAQYLGDCPVVSIPGRRFPVTAHHTSIDAVIADREAKLRAWSPEAAVSGAAGAASALHVAGVEPHSDGDLQTTRAVRATCWQAFREAMRECSEDGAGAVVLAFLPSEDSLSLAEADLAWLLRFAAAGRAAPPRATSMLVQSLRSDASPQEQHAVLTGGGGHGVRVVLTTSIAETSLTIAGVSVVVDCGLESVVMYDRAQRMDAARVVPISKSSALQRQGRAGRTRPGRCVRLFTADELEAMPSQRVPELLRSDLSHSVLRLLAAGVDPLRFPLVQAPPVAAIVDAVSTLELLGAVELCEDGPEGLAVAATGFGEILHAFGLPPMVAAMVLKGATENGYAQAAVEAAAVLAAGDESLLSASHSWPEILWSSYGDVVTAARFYRLWRSTRSHARRRELCELAGVKPATMVNARRVEEEAWAVLGHLGLAERPEGCMEMRCEVAAIRASEGRGGPAAASPQPAVASQPQEDGWTQVGSGPRGGGIGARLLASPSPFAPLGDDGDASRDGMADSLPAWTPSPPKAHRLPADLRSVFSAAEERALAKSIVGGFFLQACHSNGPAGSGYTLVRHEAARAADLALAVRRAQRMRGVSDHQPSSDEAPRLAAEAPDVAADPPATVVHPHHLSVMSRLSGSIAPSIVFIGLQRAGHNYARGITEARSEWLHDAAPDLFPPRPPPSPLASHLVAVRSDAVRELLAGRAGSRIGWLEQRLAPMSVIDTDPRDHAGKALPGQWRVWAPASDVDVAAATLNDVVSQAQAHAQREAIVLASGRARGVVGAGMALQQLLPIADDPTISLAASASLLDGPRDNPLSWSALFEALRIRISAMLERAQARAVVAGNHIYHAVDGLADPSAGWQRAELKGGSVTSLLPFGEDRLPPRSWADLAAFGAVGSTLLECQEAGMSAPGREDLARERLLLRSPDDRDGIEADEAGDALLSQLAREAASSVDARDTDRCRELALRDSPPRLEALPAGWRRSTFAKAELVAITQRIAALQSRPFLFWAPTPSSGARRAVASVILVTPSLRHVVSHAIKQLSRDLASASRSQTSGHLPERGAAQGLQVSALSTAGLPAIPAEDSDGNASLELVSQPRLEAPKGLEPAQYDGIPTSETGAQLRRRMPRSAKQTWRSDLEPARFSLVRMAWRVRSERRLVTVLLVPNRDAGRLLELDVPSEIARIRGSVPLTAAAASGAGHDAPAPAASSVPCFWLTIRRASPRSVAVAVSGLPCAVGPEAGAVFGFRVLESLGAESAGVTIVKTALMRPLLAREAELEEAARFGVPGVPAAPSDVGEQQAAFAAFGPHEWVTVPCSEVRRQAAMRGPVSPASEFPPQWHLPPELSDLPASVLEPPARLPGLGEDELLLPGGPEMMSGRDWHADLKRRSSAAENGLSTADAALVNTTCAEALRRLASLTSVLSHEVLSLRDGVVVMQARVPADRRAASAAVALNKMSDLAPGCRLFARCELACAVQLPCLALRFFVQDLRGLWAHLNGYSGDSARADGFMRPDGADAMRHNYDGWRGDGEATVPAEQRVRLGGGLQCMATSCSSSSMFAAGEVWVSSASPAALRTAHRFLKTLLGRSALGDPHSGKQLSGEDCVRLLDSSGPLQRQVVRLAKTSGLFITKTFKRDAAEVWGPPARAAAFCEQALELAGIGASAAASARVELAPGAVDIAVDIGDKRMVAAVALARRGIDPADALERVAVPPLEEALESLSIRVVPQECAIEAAP
ncbi:hypothetical protein FNF28_04569 [Cafeteria roenbergensis]|uniref:Uncharacterized protein n=2 Tax=Cafeteria roenbergensis TaxID=33653 RepID=A0A5A8DFW7_CAFRO|nr:hypothetical protein FNF28_04569 [Cafeteria roenbergensis]